MNIEELKLVIELVRGLSSDASTVAVWWIAGHYVASLLQNLIISGTILSVAWLVARSASGLSEWASAGKSVARAWGADGHTPYYNSDQEAIQRAIDAGRNKK
jgi:hypothetical protein